MEALRSIIKKKEWGRIFIIDSYILRKQNIEGLVLNYLFYLPSIHNSSSYLSTVALFFVSTLTIPARAGHFSI
jgi:hypothetical protein